MRNNLPVELWSEIFEFAIALSSFFDNRWEAGAITAFTDALPFHPHQAYELSLATKKAILLVCKDWNEIAYGINLRHIVIKRIEHFRVILEKMESSKAQAVAHPSTSLNRRRIPLGWNVTHVKLLVTTSPYYQRCGDDTSNDKGLITSYIRRLIACCPRLSVLLDATPYGITEPTPLSFQVANTDSTRQSPLKSLVWTFGGPFLEDMADAPLMVKNLSSLQCITIHRSSTINPPILMLANLVQLDMSISWQNHTHWIVAASAILPSLTHLTVRVPVPGDVLLTEAAVNSLDKFLVSHGPQLNYLDLRITPRELSRPIFTDGVNEQNILDIGRILSRCSALEEIVLSARWLNPPARELGVLHIDDWCHSTIRRVGLRDVARSANENAASLPERALHLISSYQASPSVIEWSADAIDCLSSTRAVAKQSSRRLRSLNSIFTALLRHSARTKSSEGCKAFPALESISLLDMDFPKKWRGFSEDELRFWTVWVQESAHRDVDIIDRGRKNLEYVPDSLPEVSQMDNHRTSLTPLITTTTPPKIKHQMSPMKPVSPFTISEHHGTVSLTTKV